VIQNHAGPDVTEVQERSKSNLDPRSIYTCIRCGTCRSVCPVLEDQGWESSGARGRMLIARELLRGRQIDRDMVNSLNTCTTCSICSESCPAGLRPPDIIEGARRELVSAGMKIDEHAKLSSAIKLIGNPFGDLSPRIGWLKDKSRLKGRADLVYFAGCFASFRYRENASRTFDLLQRFGVSALRDERCCGSPLLRTGFDATTVTEHNLGQIRAIGAETVIAGCAGCYATLKDDYPHEFQVLSVTEFLSQRIDELNLATLDITVTYHDPCHQGRKHGIYDQPRKVIREICELEEMKANRNHSRCCGGGGGLRAGYRDISMRLAKRRLDDVPDGVDYIVTSCPMCIRNLKEAGGGDKVIDLVDLLAISIGAYESERSKGVM
jgi:fumarate reductase (CoM/CoB) subunit B